MRKIVNGKRCMVFIVHFSMFVGLNIFTIKEL